MKNKQTKLQIRKGQSVRIIADLSKPKAYSKAPNNLSNNVITGDKQPSSFWVFKSLVFFLLVYCMIYFSKTRIYQICATNALRQFNLHLCLKAEQPARGSALWNVKSLPFLYKPSFPYLQVFWNWSMASLPQKVFSLLILGENISINRERWWRYWGLWAQPLVSAAQLLWLLAQRFHFRSQWNAWGLLWQLAPKAKGRKLLAF